MEEARGRSAEWKRHVSTQRPVVAVVLAGGSGKRTGLTEPKQFWKLGGLTVLERAVAAFDRSELIDQILVVASASDLERTRGLLSASSLAKVSAVIAGGSERHDSSRAAVEHLRDQDVDILIHDAARPFVSGDLISRCVHALADAQAVEPVLASADSLVKVEDGVVRAPVVRQEVFRVQTPQGFRLTVLQDAFDQAALADAAELTDDVTVVLNYRPDVRVAAIAGDERNIKITTPADLDLAAWLAESAESEPDTLSSELKAAKETSHD